MMTWAEFKQELNHKFLNTACKQKAQQQFEVMHQHQNETIADFFIHLELILGIAEYSKEDNYVVDKLKHMINPRIITQIYRYAQGEIPMKYDKWKKITIHIDELWHHKDAEKAWESGISRWFGYVQGQNQPQQQPQQ